MPRGVRRLVGRVDERVHDRHGTTSRRGVPGRPGVMTRLAGIEERLGSVEPEPHPDSGGSLRDAVHRVDVRTRQIAADTV
ncbi:hypothetical protein [Streptomyces pratensis]|uniref:hypothetical protein n=1 Tax=Streptomyces pratensis TaxID=1169025 RepID=UPI0030159418